MSDEIEEDKVVRLCKWKNQNIGHYEQMDLLNFSMQTKSTAVFNLL